MDGFEDVAVLHADAQALGLAFAGQLATCLVLAGLRFENGKLCFNEIQV